MAALVFCQPQRVDLSVINGQVVVDDGRLLTVDLEPVVAHQNQIVTRIAYSNPVSHGLAHIGVNYRHAHDLVQVARRQERLNPVPVG